VRKDAWRVATLNIWNRQGPWPERLPLIRTALLALDADVIGLQEVLGFAGLTMLAWSAWIVGTGIVSLAFFAMYKPAVWGDAIGIMAGAWLLASPWMLGFAAAPAAAMNAVIIGVLVICYALWAMRIDITFGDGAAYDTSSNQINGGSVWRSK